MISWFWIKVQRQFKGERTVFFNKWCWHNWISILKRKNLTISHIKVQDKKWITDQLQNLNYETSGRKHRRKSLWPWVNKKDFNSTIHKEKKGILDFIEIKTGQQKILVKGMKRQTTDLEKTCAKHIIRQRAWIRIYNKLSKFNNEKNHPIKHTSKRFEHFNKENIQTASKDFPGGAVVKNPPANAGDTGSSPGPGRSHMPRSN